MQKFLFSAENKSKILWKHLAERGNLYTSRFYYSKKHKIINISKNIHFRNQCLIAFLLHCYSKNSYKDNIKNSKKMRKVKIFYFFGHLKKNLPDLYLIYYTKIEFFFSLNCFKSGRFVLRGNIFSNIQLLITNHLVSGS